MSSRGDPRNLNVSIEAQGIFHNFKELFRWILVSVASCLKRSFNLKPVIKDEMFYILMNFYMPGILVDELIADKYIKGKFSDGLGICNRLSFSSIVLLIFRFLILCLSFTYIKLKSGCMLNNVM